MKNIEYCSFCGRILQNEFSYCPFCGVQCRDSRETDLHFGRSDETAQRTEGCGALHRLEELESALTDMEAELDLFLATKNG